VTPASQNKHFNAPLRGMVFKQRRKFVFVYYKIIAISPTPATWKDYAKKK
jgi:hypothetical protein